MAIVANDKIADWLLPFLESWKRTNAHIPLYLIPYDDGLTITRRAADAYGVTMVESVSPEIDRLAADLYPLFPGYRRRLRKLQSLALPLDEVVYIDVDVVLFRDFAPMFGHLKKGESEFLIASPSFEYVYNKKKDEVPDLKDAMLFNDGYFLTSNKLLNPQMFVETMERDAKLFHKVRKRGMLFAQPVVNFTVHRNHLKIALMSDLVPNASHETFYKAKGVTFKDGMPLDSAGKEIYFCHWAGLQSLPGKLAFDDAWRDFSQAAWAKVRR
ncbi:MAG: hypothetical protein KGL46_01420 [Hyphomicrobiales bacterium]|nr:hypothetical protein [Hyphomicrobiales bacterium]